LIVISGNAKFMVTPWMLCPAMASSALRCAPCTASTVLLTVDVRFCTSATAGGADSAADMARPARLTLAPVSRAYAAVRLPSVAASPAKVDCCADERRKRAVEVPARVASRAF
jgi:hypothetical protein